MTILVTGATGFVGLNLLDDLLRRGERVVAVATRPVPEAATRRWTGLPGSLAAVLGDVRDRERIAALLREHRVTRVAHAAAITSNAARERADPQPVLDVNLGGLASVAQAAAEHGVERFLLFGSIAAFGSETPDGALLEEDWPQRPTTLYALTKSAAETALARIAGLHGMDWVIGRLGTVFGPWEHDTGLRDTLSPLHQVTSAAFAGRRVRLPRPAIRNWHYASDAARGLCTLLLAPTHAHRHYNLGSSHVWALQAWCERLAERVPGFAFTVGDGDGDVVELYGERDGGLLSWQRYEAEFGGSGRFDLEAAFADYLTFLETTDRFGLTR